LNASDPVEKQPVIAKSYLNSIKDNDDKNQASYGKVEI